MIALYLQIILAAADPPNLREELEAQIFPEIVDYLLVAAGVGASALIVKSIASR